MEKESMRSKQKIGSIVFSLTLVILALLVAPASATKPAIPQFTLTYEKHPYDTQPQYTTDPYTGKSVISVDSYHYDNESIIVKISNQPLTSKIDSTGNKTSLFYSFRFKGHYSSEWTDYRDCYYDISSDHYFHYSGYFNASDSEYTLAELRMIAIGNDLQDGSKVDIQCRALIGHVDQVYYFTPMGDGYSPVFVGEMSDWSQTQTITVGTGETTTSPTEQPTQPTPTQTTTETPTATPTLVPTTTPQDSQRPGSDSIQILDWQTTAIIGLSVAVVVLAVGLAVVWRKLPRK
jgi:hypothetical protein